MHHVGRGGEQRAEHRAPFLECRTFAETDIVVFQRFPPHQQQEAFRILDALAHFNLVEPLGGGDVRACLGEGSLKGFSLARLHGNEGAFEDHRALLILAATGSSVAASTMTLPCGASGTPSHSGKTWKWTWQMVCPAGARLYWRI